MDQNLQSYKEDIEDEKDNPYRSIYVLNKTFVADDELCPEIRMFEPRKDDHGRLVNQAGLFTFSPYDSTIENKLTDTLSSEEFEDDALRSASEDEQAGIIARYICKIYIKNEDRDGCMRHLRRMNVHHASLFPDLIGASDYCNLMVAEERAQYELEESAKRAAASPQHEEAASSASAMVEAKEEVKPSRTFIADDKETAWIALLLDRLADSSLSHGQAQLLGEKVTAALNQLKSVDWQERENIQSQMRTKMRILLRKYHYPEGKRNSAIDNIMAFLLRSSDNRAA